MPTSPQPETVADYLKQLRAALKGASPGLVSDALADAEDHLNSEIATNPTKTEGQVLASVIETYGTPSEIAEEYRSMEATIAGPFPKAEKQPASGNGFFGVIRDPRAYGALVYMLLSLVTGVFYFVWAVTGLSLTAGLIILIVGIPFALLFIGSVRVISHVEGRIIEGLLGVRMPRRLPSAGSDQTLGARITDALADVRTWSSLFYMLLMLPLGLVYFVIALVGISLSLSLTFGSLWGLITGESHVQVSDVPWLQHLLHTAPGLLLLMLVGVLLIFVLLHVAKAVGWLHGKIAETLLVRL